MTAAVEHIKKAISRLAPDEVRLFLELQRDFPPSGQEPHEDGTASVEAAWDAEIDTRIKEIEEGKTALISGEDFDRHVDELFAQRGITRTRHA